MADDAATLRPRWEELCQELGVVKADPEAVQRWWKSLAELHGEPQRHYHTLAHLRELFGHFDRHRDSIKDHIAVKLAIFFHDAVYQPRSGSPKNEADSAQLFQRFGEEVLPRGDPPGRAKGELIGKVSKWILQTADHKCSPTDEEDCKLFMDFDMAVLGRPWEEYQTYSKQIKMEYGHVPEPAFCEARKAFLEAAAAGPPIYATTAFQASHETQARDNMRMEAKALEARFRSFSLVARLSCVVAMRLRKESRKLWGAGALLACGALLVKAPSAALALLGVAGISAAALYLKFKFGTKIVKFPYPTPAERGGTAVMAGSFNPPHLGHLQMAKYLSTRHEQVHMIIGVNPAKTYEVNAHERQELLRAMVAELGLSNVQVHVYTSIIFVYAHALGATTMYRGIRTWKEDGEGEKKLEGLNLGYQMVRGYWPIPTVFLESNPELVNLSSTLLRQRVADGADISDLVPAGTCSAVAAAYGPR
mmetsp:Transcript_141561/g.440066  ORF Transcript_141561/g.440066 Transcript_141561/m.440066 type:complete len:477 (-) Transcript_141561:48-1478(-)